MIIPLSASPARHILIVDDEPLNRELLGDHMEILGYTSVAAAGGSEAIAALDAGISLVLLDVMMPEMDGFAVTRAIRAHPTCANVPIILCTALESRVDRLCGVEAGANDFISKPIDKMELRVRMRSLLQMKDAQDALRCHLAELEETVARRTQELQAALEEVGGSHRDTVRRLALAAEYRDGHTAAHLERVGHYCALMGRLLGQPEEQIDLLYHGSTMHDVGKIGIPDAILLKPDVLSPEERIAMQEHTRIGAKLLGGSQSPLLQAGELIAFTHHERWDGDGYPCGLAGDAIPLWGRICAIADVFDALTSTRPYKPAYTLKETHALMCQARGTQFDPVLLDLFLDHFSEIAQIWGQHTDH